MGLLFSIISLFLPNKWKINIAIFIFSSIIAAYGIELVLSILDNTQFLPTKIDTRSKLEVIEDLRAEGIDAWPQVLAWLFTKTGGLPSYQERLFPLGGISNKTIVYCNETGQYKIFKSDEHGFNNPKGLYKKGEIKIALIGDSFTIGSCVKEGEDIGSLFRNMGFNTLNLGNGGNGPLIELATLKEYVEPLQPEIVLWIYYEGNDLLDLERERKVSILMDYLENENYTQNLLQRQKEIDVALRRYVNSQWVKEKNLHKTILQEDQKRRQKKGRNLQRIIKLWYLRNRLGLLLEHKIIRKVNFKTQLPLFSKILATAKQRVSNWGGRLYFVYLPTMERYIGNYKGDFYDRDDVLNIVQKVGLPVIDFHEVLNKHPDPLSLTPFLGAHYNAEGYKLLTNFIINRLRKDDVI